MASSEFTFVHPSSTNPVVSTGYNIDCHVPQNIFSPINYALPTTIQFPTPPATSVPFSGSGFGSCETETAINLASYNGTQVPWPNACMTPSQSSLPSSSDVSMLSERALICLEQSHASTLEMSNLCLGKFTCDTQSQTRCKRKAVDIPEDCWIPTKIHVNEERMSACMNDLHLDNNNIGAQPNFENEMWYSRGAMRNEGTNPAVQPECLDVGQVSACSLGQESYRLGLNGNSRLELCRELQFGMKTKEILPKAVLDEVVKSSMQIVLWKPPEIFGPNLLNTSEVGKTETNDEYSNTEDGQISNGHSPFEAISTSFSPIFYDKWLSKSDLSEAASPTAATMNECEEMDL